MATATPAAATTRLGLVVAVVVLISTTASAHEHHGDAIPEGETVSKDPLDTIMWLHILLQTLVFGILFPLGMVLGIIKSRWHVPLQIVASLLSVLGLALGHMHSGRQFISNNVHSTFANWVYILLFIQVLLGGYLKLHLEKGIHGKIRRVIRVAHSINGKAFPVVSWVQMIFGGITALGFCQGEHVGQCAAHFIMGSAFIAYGILLTIALVVGQQWVKRTGRSQEFFDSAVIAAWGCINTFTEHRWGTAWVKNDWQHTTMGIVWWCAGLAGVWLSRGRDGSPKRNFIPGFVLFITGWAMGAHPQHEMVSAATHSMFGYTLMATGVVRIIEVAFVTKDKTGISEDGYEANSFQFITPFLLMASGFLFMGATEEQMDLVAKSPMDHISYILILFSLASLMFLLTNMLVGLYDRSANADKHSKRTVGRTRMNGHSRTQSRQIRDAEEFELEGLVSDEEDEERKLLSSGDAGPESPSTLGRNSDRLAS